MYGGTSTYFTLVLCTLCLRLSEGWKVRHVNLIAAFHNFGDLSRFFCLSSLQRSRRIQKVIVIQTGQINIGTTTGSTSIAYGNERGSCQSAILQPALDKSGCVIETVV